jgi:protein TBF1
LNSVGAFFCSHLPVVVDYAEKYGINIPPSEELDPQDMVPPNENHQHDELAALIQSATSNMDVDGDQQADRIKREIVPNDQSMSLADGLNLGELIAQSLSGQDEFGAVDGLPRMDDTSTMDDTFDATGLASLIAESMGSSVDNGQSNGYTAGPFPPTIQGPNGGEPNPSLSGGRVKSY